MTIDQDNYLICDWCGKRSEHLEFSGEYKIIGEVKVYKDCRLACDTCLDELKSLRRSEKNHCLRCGWWWFQKTDKPSARCPHCYSKHWKEEWPHMMQEKTEQPG